MINVLFTKTSEPLKESTFGALLSALPMTMQKEILKYKHWEDRQRSLLGKMLLKKGLKDLGLAGYTLSDLKFTQFNKPYFNDIVDFNISHSGEIVVCAISQTHKLGVDVEEIKPVPFKDFTANFAASEWKEIYEDANALKSFYKFWTQKEAFLKAIGMGLNVSLNDVTFTNHKIIWETSEWFLKEIKLDENYAAHLCSNAVAHEVFLERVEYE